MSHLVHGMDGGLAEPVWPALTAAEVERILDRYAVGARDVSIVWRSPRPMSAAAVAEASGRRLFVKRHSPEVRTAAHLGVEHSFAAWLLTRGVPVPAVLATEAGATVVETPDGLYEVHEAMAGEDRYRDALSWTPYRSAADATAAGRALARLHTSSEGFDRPPHPLGVLTDSAALITASGPLAAVEAHVASRPVLAHYLRHRNWKAEIARALGPPLERAAAAGLASAPPLWTHGDWHPSNLSWAGSRVAGVFDFGLANRTFAMHDLAVAIERSCVDWQGPGWAIDEPSLRGLLAGYGSVRPLSDEDHRHLSACLPVAHVEYALSEVEYFAGPARSPADAELAYGTYLCGHAAGGVWTRVERMRQNMP